MLDIIILKPVFKELIWGGNKLKTAFNFDIPSNHTGECWMISAHPSGDCIIQNGIYKGKTLSDVFSSNKKLFNNSKAESFPLLVKIIDSNSDLSIQVHPDGDYARKNNTTAKDECWYILDAKADSFIIFGHSALTKQEFLEMVHDNKWNELLIKKTVKPGDFIYVPAGTIHAIGSGLLIFETQQSSDIAYRFYDYDRIDRNGLKRELHLSEAVEACTIPHCDLQINTFEDIVDNAIIKTLVSSDLFTVKRLDINGKHTIKVDTYLLVTVLSGSGKILDYDLYKGMSFIIPSTFKEISVYGNVCLMISNT